MMEQGLLDEVRALKERGLSRGSVAMQGLGYKELFGFLEGDCPLDEAVRIIKRDTRHFAKRQLTWFKRERDVIWLDKQEIGRDDGSVIGRILDVLKEKGIIDSTAGNTPQDQETDKNTDGKTTEGKESGK